MGKEWRPAANSHMNELRVDLPASIKPSDDRCPGQCINCHPRRGPEARSTQLSHSQNPDPPEL